MSRTALLFAGQGAQVVGMDLAAAFPSALAWFDRANAVLGPTLPPSFQRSGRSRTDQDGKTPSREFFS